MARNFYTEIDESKVFPIPETQSVHTSIGSSSDAENKQQGILSKTFGTNHLVDGISIRNYAPITDFFSCLRTSIIDTYNDKIVAPFETKSKKYYEYESHITRTYVDPLYTDKTELLIPGLSYTAIAFMAGSIVSRNFKPALLRLPIPLIFSLITFKYTLPSTFENTKNVLYHVESNFTTNEFLNKQQQVVEGVENTKKEAVSIYNQTVTNVDEFQKTTSSKWESLKKFTGLNV